MERAEESPEGKLRFFGAVQISEFSIDAVAKALLEELCAYIAVLPDDFSPRGILEIGWSGRFFEDLPLLEGVSEVDGLLLKRIGEFDDQEWGLIAVARPPLVNTLLS
ncbi:MAG: hypothetical protein QNJ40_26665 [Xanthomonadales bacterium]|nr:hypothetical protein [Xanthomonadales bacterium]